jgi:signal peptidase I
VTKARKSVAGSALELILVAVAALGLALAIQAFVVKPYRIPSGSMLPTLHIDQRILVDRIGTHFSSPHIGDIIVFHPPANYADGCADPAEGQEQPQPSQRDPKPCGVAQSRPSSQTFVKRVVGLPGDRIQIVGGHVYRDGVRENDSYIEPCNGIGSCDFPGTITVPRGDYYMMGDNRGVSDDSRFWGPVPKAWIIGKAFFTYWPLSRIGFL